MDNTSCGKCSVSRITQFRTCIFSKTIYIFRHLKLEIALAIPASNDKEYNSNNSAGQGLKYFVLLLYLIGACQAFLVIGWCYIVSQGNITEDTTQRHGPVNNTVIINICGIACNSINIFTKDNIDNTKTVTEVVLPQLDAITSTNN